MALLQGRRSIRSYTSDPVPSDLLEQVLEAGRWAPSASNRQPWAFVVVQDDEIRRQVAAHAAYYVVRWAVVERAPVLIALCGHRGSRIYRQFLHEDIGLAGGQMMLQAAALGLGTCWIGGLDRAAIAGILRVPTEWEIVGLLTLGFPAESPPAPRRKPLVDLVHYDTFGRFSQEASPAAGRPPGGPLRSILRRLRFTVGRRRRHS
jgi:nitroreductase